MIDAPPVERPRRLYPLRKHEMQSKLRRAKTRFNVVPAGRRSGKTELAKRKLAVAVMQAFDQPWDDPRFFAGAPTRDQAKAIYWADLKAMIPRVLVEDIRETELMIKLVTGAELHVLGMDRPERAEGRPWDGGVLDEYANMKAGVWGENIRPALSDRKGWCWLIGVPEGRNHYYELYKYAVSGVDPDWAGFAWPSKDILDPAEVEAARRQLDPLVFAQEYEGSFINFEGRCYYPFQEATHCAPLAHLYNAAAPLCFSFDFNVEPGVAVISQELKLPGQYQRDKNGLAMLDKPITGTAVIGEVHIPRNSNTPAVCAKLIQEWGRHPTLVKCYGDSTGGARGTAKVSGSDWDLIKQHLGAHFKDRVYYLVPPSNPAERARVNAMNSRLYNGAKEIRLMVDPATAPNVVKDLEGVRTLKGGSGEIDKKADPLLTHISDALGYYVAKEFPLAPRTASFEPLRA